VIEGGDRENRKGLNGGEQDSAGGTPKRIEVFLELLIKNPQTFACGGGGRRRAEKNRGEGTCITQERVRPLTHGRREDDHQKGQRG